MTPSGSTQLIGLFGWPVAQSKSPQMHTAAAEALGLDLVYLPFPVHPDQLGDAVNGLAPLGVLGVNLTVPHKQAVVPYLDRLTEAAEALDAVNTILIDRTDVSRPAKLVGHNTDTSGFLTDLKSVGVDPAGQACLVFGGGGSSRAVVYALAKAGASTIYLLTRRQSQRDEMISQLELYLPHMNCIGYPVEACPDIVGKHDSLIIINTTPLGMTPHIDTSVWQAGWAFPPNGFVYDLVYNPAETRLMRQAAEVGLQSANGLGMLIHQGAEAFKMWTGLDPDLNVMRQAILK